MSGKWLFSALVRWHMAWRSRFFVPACNAIEELEDMTRLALLTRGMNPRMLTDAQMRNVVTGFDIEWDE
jgi:hypothetical protein